MLATATGWTFDQIGEHTLWDVHHLLRYWERYPPAHISMREMRRMLTVWMGGKDETQKPKEATLDDVLAMNAALN